MRVLSVAGIKAPRDAVYLESSPLAGCSTYLTQPRSLCFCLCVCMQDYIKTIRQILPKFRGDVGNGPT